ncbi:MAG: hypothetical protein IJ300_13645 [Clostridia bacterium]|nr:hypothetical protein [Clostridia bacterium]
MKKAKKFVTMVVAMTMTVLVPLGGCDNSEPKKGETKKAVEVVSNLAKDAAPIGSNIVVINDVEYELPMRVSELMANGWKDNANKFNFETRISEMELANCFLYTDDGERITIDKVANDLGRKATLKECLVLSLSIEQSDKISFPKSFIFPGGVTEKCTESDVISVYGDTTDTKIFSDESETCEIMSLVGSNAPFKAADKEAYYKKHINTGTSYTFYYDEDNSNIICGAKINIVWDN